MEAITLTIEAGGTYYLDEWMGGIRASLENEGVVVIQHRLPSQQ